MKALPRHTEVLIVGGGIVGAGLFRDLALHRVPCVLVEKGDFSSQTSQSSSKMLHGGIRYLEQLDFDLVKEALHEKNLWLAQAPHVCREFRFTLPVYQDSKVPLWKLRLGLSLYDSLSRGQNTPHRLLRVPELQHRFPLLRSQGLQGAGEYSDALVDDAQLVLDCLYDGSVEPNCYARNYHQVTAVERLDRGRYRVRLLIHSPQGSREEIICCQHIVYCLGPFTDYILPRLGLTHWRPRLLLSKGIHLWLRQEDVPLSSPLVIQSQDQRVIFILPHKEAVLVGTTEDPVRGDLFAQEAQEGEIEYLLRELQRYFPSLKLGLHQVQRAFAGIRPLVRDDQHLDPHQVSRRHQVFRPDSHSYVIVGGKYTTFRTMVQDTARALCLQRGLPYSPSKTRAPFRRRCAFSAFNGGPLPSAAQIQELKSQENLQHPDDLYLRRLGLPWVRDTF